MTGPGVPESVLHTAVGAAMQGAIVILLLIGHGHSSQPGRGLTSKGPEAQYAAEGRDEGQCDRAGTVIWGCLQGW